MSKHYPKIQLKRSKLAYDNTAIKEDTELDFGEPLFLNDDPNNNNNSYIIIGGVKDDEHKAVINQKLMKLFGKDIVDVSLFYQDIPDPPEAPGAKLIYLINDQKDQVFLVSTGIKKTDGKSLDVDIEDIWAELLRLDDVKAPKAGPTFTKDGDKWPTSVTPDWTSNNTTIATTSFVRSIISHISELKFVSGTGWKIKKTPTTENKNFYVCGVSAQDEPFYYCTSGSQSNNGVYFNGSTGVLHGACWNDFAEYRECNNAPAGTVVCEVGDGTLSISSERLQAGASIISDTYGMVIGNETETASPIAVAGRVLAKYSGNIEDYKAGSPVCASEDGKIAVMTREEIKEYPDRILGYVSEIPSYDTWNNVSVDNRIWIKIK